MKDPALGLKNVCEFIEVEPSFKFRNILTSQSIEFFKIDRNYIITGWAEKTGEYNA